MTQWIDSLVETPHGLMPAAEVAKEEKWKQDAAKKREEFLAEVTERRAKTLPFGVKAADLRAMRKAPLATLQRAAKKARENHTPATLAKAYPCRTCRVVKDEHYRAACKTLAKVPCFISHHWRGCPTWQPQPPRGVVPASFGAHLPVIGQPPPTPAAKSTNHGGTA